MLRRIIAAAARLVALTIAWTVAFGVACAPHAGAHDGVNVTVHTDGVGGVWATVTWVDGHPVTERVTALMTAISAQGQRVGPEALSAAPAAGMVSYAGTLAAGEWAVSVDVALPAVGHCEATVVVAADGASASRVRRGAWPRPRPRPRRSPPPRAASGAAAVVAPIVVVAGLIGGACSGWRCRLDRPPSGRR